MSNRLLPLVRSLAGLLLDPEGDFNLEENQPATQGTSQEPTQQQLLQELLVACAEDPEAASQILHAHPDQGSQTPLYPLLLSSLQDGYMEAAQFLMLAQIHHKHTTEHTVQPPGRLPVTDEHPDETRATSTCSGDTAGQGLSCTNSSSSSSGSSSSVPPTSWPPMVYNRLACLVQDAGSPEAVQVVSMRLLAVAAAALCNSSASARSAPPTHSGASRTAAAIPAALLQFVQQLEAGLEDAAVTDTPSDVNGSPSHHWVAAMGPDAASTAAQLITSLAMAALPQPPTAPATAATAVPPSILSGVTAAHGTHSTTATGPAAADTTSNNLHEAAPAQHPAARALGKALAAPPAEYLASPAVNPSLVPHTVKALLQLLKSFQHPASTAHQLPQTQSTAIPPALYRQHPTLSLQLQMLTEVGHGQAAHQIDCLVQAHIAASPSSTAAAGVGVSRPGAAAASAAAAAGKMRPGSSCVSACCAAGMDVLRCMTVLVLQDTTGAAASNAQFVQGVLQLVKDLVQSSPKVTSQQLDWSGQPTGFTLAPAAAAACRVKLPKTAQGATAAAMAALAAASNPASSTSSSAQQAPGTVLAGSQLQDPLLPAWHAPGVSELYSMWLHAWGLGQPSTTLEAAMLLLLALCQAGTWAAAAVLYAADVSSVLEQLCSFVTPEVRLVLQKIYRCLCIHSGQLRDEVMQDARILALQELIAPAAAVPTAAASMLSLQLPPTPQAPASASAAAARSATATASAAGGNAGFRLAVPAVPLKLQAAAMGRLSGALDAASGADFLAFTGMTSTQKTIRPSTSRGSTSSSFSICGLGVVTGLLLQGQAASQFSGLENAGPDGASSKQQQQVKQVLLGDARQVFLTCMNRARQMQQLSRQQLPRGGFWSATDSNLLRQVEAMCLNPAAAAVPGLNPAASSTAGAAQSTGQAGQAGGSSMSNSENRGNTREMERSGRGSNGGSRSSSSGRAVEGSSSTSSTSRRRAGNAVPGSVTSGRNASAVDAQAGDSAAYDEDGLREVWSSGPSAATVNARAVWKQLSLSDTVSWTQSSSDLEMRLLLPGGTRKQDLVVSIQPDRLTVRLNWYGRVLDGPLKKRVKASEACWSLDTTDVDLAQMKQTPKHDPNNNTTGPSANREAASGTGVVQMTELLLILPKEEAGRYWRALFDGGDEKSHLQVLQEALSNEDDARHAPTVDQLGPEAALLLEELRERQELMTSGQWSIEHSFDDFRLVLGDNTM